MRRAIPACLVAAFIALPAAAHAQDGQPPASKFEKVTLNDRPGEPVSLAVLPDRRVLHTARTGEVRLFDPRTQVNSLAADVDVYQHDEEGLQGIALDPNFDNNRWVYLYYSPNTFDTPLDDPLTPEINEGDAPFTGTQADWDRFKGAVRLSRFKFEGGELKLGTEQQIIDVPVDRGICCHVGGQIAFDPQGNLLLSTGDDSNPFESDGFTPIDERADRHPAFDAQRTSGNTNDLRGKVLRIRPKAGGGYDIPPGNLFPLGTPRTKPEIYVMGLRNPFRFDVNPKTGDLYMADYSPDAGEADPARGPAGHGRWMLIRKAANYGWPYCVSPDLAYVDYDFATETSGEQFNCTRPVNDSPHNTGQRVLPQVAQPDVAYSYTNDGLFPELFEPADHGTGISPMAGPAYQFAQGNPSLFKWPKYYNGQPLFYEWSRDYIKEFRLNKPNGPRLADIRHVNVPLGYSWVDPAGDPDHPVDNPIDMEFGPDGALYVLEYGDGYFAENPDAKLTKVNFVRGNRSPVVKVAAEGQPNPNVPLELLLDEDPTVAFSSAGTNDPDGDTVTYQWDFNSDGTTDSREPNAEYTYAENGKFDATLKVTDRTGRTSSASVPIIVGNKTPKVTLTTSPAPGEPFAFGQAVTYTVAIEDDEEADCSKVIVSYILGHDDHGHPITAAAGCTGSITTSLAGHDPSADLRAVFNASYTDEPVDEDVPPLTGSAQVEIEPTAAP